MGLERELTLGTWTMTKCFLWSILAHLYPLNEQMDNVELYKPYETDLNMGGISYPVSLPAINTFEGQNIDFAVNVFGYENKEVVPLRITKLRNKKYHVNLLLLTTVETAHYCLVTDLDRFLHRTKSDGHRHYFCQYCLQGFKKQSTLSKHQPYCSSGEEQKIVLPTPDEDDVLQFKDFSKQMRVPFVIYCDFETLNRKIDSCAPDPGSSSTTTTRQLDVCSFGL